MNAFTLMRLLSEFEANDLLINRLIDRLVQIEAEKMDYKIRTYEAKLKALASNKE